MRRLALLVFSVVALSGCWAWPDGSVHYGMDTGDARCNRLLEDATNIGYWIVDDHHYTVSCVPPANLHPPPGTLGWNDKADAAIYLWANQMPNDAELVMVAGHEEGHIRFDDEARASAVSWCNWPQNGVGMPGYTTPPDGCAPYYP